MKIVLKQYFISIEMFPLELSFLLKNIKIYTSISQFDGKIMVKQGLKMFFYFILLSANRKAKIIKYTFSSVLQSLVRFMLDP